MCVILGSRRSRLGWEISAAEVQLVPSLDARTRIFPSGETWPAPSRKTQRNSLLWRIKSVKALWGAESQMRRASIKRGAAIVDGIKRRAR